ncbi:MAG: hypothetical protein GX376_07870 [Firmicutes bacterium]|nr:hypothetical protein [Bacillota bacterium]
MAPGKDVLTEMTLFSLGQQGKNGPDMVARRLSSLETAVRKMGYNSRSDGDDYGFYL